MDLERKIIDFSKKRDKFTTTELLDSINHAVSRPTLLKTVDALVRQQKLVRVGKRRGAFYTTPAKLKKIGLKVEKRMKNEHLREHEVFETVKREAPFLQELDENLGSIFYYAFSEMLNNAIEHSRSKYIELAVQKRTRVLEFTIRDFGIGVFRNVMKQRKLANEIEAAQDLTKGKVTTAPQAHSGEGIFFTSKIADLFVLDSYGLRLRVDNAVDDIFIEETGDAPEGTKVTFRIALDTGRHLSDVFRQYQTHPESYDFNKTEIKVKLFTMGTIYISRSQARRVLDGLEKFKKIILDFADVPTVGQAFADEIFRVFQHRHPDITVEPVNMNDVVGFMVKRAME